MSARIVVFGATGYTGRLVAEALVERGERPVLAGRDAARLAAVAAPLGGLPTVVADASRSESVAAALEPGDVLISTVGPFTRLGGPAVQAAAGLGATYLDSTGEGAFIREVFERHDARARRTGARMLPALGYDWAPGNLAGALALREAGDAATALEVGYFLSGNDTLAMSAGTSATTVSSLADRSYTFRDGALRTERAAARVRSFDVEGRRRPALSVGATEQLSLPRLHDGVRNVDVYLGWFGGRTRALQAFGLGVGALTALPPGRSLLRALTARAARGRSGAGPDEAARSETGSVVVAVARAADGVPLAEVRLVGTNPYTFTARFLAWAAAEARAGRIKGTGALGPAEAFDLDVLERGMAEAGIERVE